MVRLLQRNILLEGNIPAYFCLVCALSFLGKTSEKVAADRLEQGQPSSSSVTVS